MSAPELDRKGRWPPLEAQQAEVRYDGDTSFHELYDRAQAVTGMPNRAIRRQRHYLIPQAIRQVRNVPGDAAEVGCFRGLSAFVACSTFTELGLTPAFHVFDSFEGLSQPTPPDVSATLPVAKDSGNPFACSEAEVRENLSFFPFVNLYKGWVPARFDEVADRRFRYVHIDVDLYEPTRECVVFFWPRLAPGGVMVLDDYATTFYPGARIALDEYFETRRDSFIVETPAGSAVAVKLGDQGLP